MRGRTPRRIYPILLLLLLAISISTLSKMKERSFSAVSRHENTTFSRLITGCHRCQEAEMASSFHFSRPSKSKRHMLISVVAIGLCLRVSFEWIVVVQMTTMGRYGRMGNGISGSSRSRLAVLSCAFASLMVDDGSNHLTAGEWISSEEKERFRMRIRWIKRA